jgi:Flp pilus assembly protein TadB
MADRIEREIEEILERLDSELPGGALPDDKKPISLMQRRQQATQKKAPRAPRGPRQSPRWGVTPAHLLFTGAALTVGGFLLSGLAGILIWVSMAGVALFLAAFIWSLMRGATARPGASGYQPPKGVYWRDRYIEYDPPSSSPWARIKRRFRR